MKRILTIQDISCVGQCSLTVALPIISACGIETCILPSAVLSTHTSGFQGFTFRDLTDDMPKILAHWQKEGIKFSGLYTGYLGSSRQIEYVKNIADACLEKGAPLIVDPAMADNGKLYPGFDLAFVGEMRKLCVCADIILPNITEACLLTGIEYKEKYDEAYIEYILASLTEMGAKTVVLTGVGYNESTTGVVVLEDGKAKYYPHRKVCKGCHGTGDVYASAFVGAYLNGKPCFESARIAADFTVECIENTIDDSEHWYGVKFEPCLKTLANKF